MTLPIPHRPVSQIERDLFQLRNAPKPDIPNLGPLQAAVQHWTTQALINSAYQPQLIEADRKHREAIEVIAESGRRNSQINELDRELQEAVAADRIEKATAADEALSQAINEYKHAGLVAAKALRHLLNVQHQSQQVPGANHNLSSLRLNGFHIPHLYPISFQGSLGEAMTQGLQQFEQHIPSLKVAA